MTRKQVTILISELKGFKTKVIKKAKEGHIIINKWINIRILHLLTYISNIGVFKYIQQIHT